ncbi:MAG: type I-E CRISPR-associated protein Cas5/CasD [Verrucomicrobiales bacterium]
MNSATLAVVLDAPLQSWGHASQFQHRTTAAHPTKSGVLGLVAAALGIDRNASDEADLLVPFAALHFTSLRVPRPHPRRNERLLPVLRLEDYHTVGGGYDEDDPRERLCIPRKAERGGVFGTVVTRRTYLQQARFIIFMEGYRASIDRIATALQNPVWGVWLGRKSCVPAVPVQPVIAESRASALVILLRRIRYPQPDAPETDFDREETATDASQAHHFLADQPLGYGSRQFSHRGITVHRAPRPAPGSGE